jgi:hypothetical protein
VLHEIVLFSRRLAFSRAVDRIFVCRIYREPFMARLIPSPPPTGA